MFKDLGVARIRQFVRIFTLYVQSKHVQLLHKYN